MRLSRGKNRKLFLGYDFALNPPTAPVVPPEPTIAPPQIQSHSFTDGGQASVNAYTLAKPTGVVAGDLLLFIASCDLGPDTATWTTVPAGVTAIGTDVIADAGSTGQQINAWYKIAGGAEPANYDFYKNRFIKGAVTCLRITGHDPVTPIGAYLASLNTNSEPIIPALDMVKKQSLQLNLISWDTSRTLNSGSYGWNTRLHIDYSGHDQLIRYRTQADGAQTISEALDLSAATPWVCIGVIINAAGAPNVSGHFTAEKSGTGVETVAPAILLSSWKVQLPVKADGTRAGGTNAHEVAAVGYTSQWFDVLTDGKIRMMCPNDAERTSSGTAYGRVELREMNGSSEASWTVAQGGSLTYTVSLERQSDEDSGVRGRVCIGQVKGPTNERVRIQIDKNGAVTYFDDLAAQYPLLNGATPLVVAHGIPMQVTMAVNNAGATVTIVYQGVTYTATNANVAGWTGVGLYFKCGNYSLTGLASNGANNPGPADAYSSVILEALAAPIH